MFRVSSLSFRILNVVEIVLAGEGRSLLELHSSWRNNIFVAGLLSSNPKSYIVKFVWKSSAR